MDATNKINILSNISLRTVNNVEEVEVCPETSRSIDTQTKDKCDTPISKPPSENNNVLDAANHTKDESKPMRSIDIQTNFTVDKLDVPIEASEFTKNLKNNILDSTSNIENDLKYTKSDLIPSKNTDPLISNKIKSNKKKPREKRKTKSKTVPIEVEKTYNYLTGTYEAVVRKTEAEALKYEMEIDIEEHSINEHCENTARNDAIQQEIKNKPIDLTRIKDRTQTHKCTKCSFTTDSKETLKIHTYNDHLSNQFLLKYKCTRCNFMSDQAQDMKDHKAEFKGHKSENLLILRVSKEVEIADQIYYCSRCSKFQTTDEFELKKHMIGHKKKLIINKYRCEICSFKTYRTDHFQRHLGTHVDRQKTSNNFKCFHCPYVTLRKEHLKSHIFQHKKNKDLTFACRDHSGKRFEKACKACVYEQVFNSVTDSSAFVCGDCGHKCFRKDHFTKHLKRCIKISKEKM